MSKKGNDLSVFKGTDPHKHGVYINSYKLCGLFIVFEKKYICLIIITLPILNHTRIDYEAQILQKDQNLE